MENSRHAYFKFDLSSIETDRYDIDEMKMMLSFRKSHAPNELVFTESESTLRNTSTEWTVTNVTYNNRPYRYRRISGCNTQCYINRRRKPVH